MPVDVVVPGQLELTASYQTLVTAAGDLTIRGITIANTTAGVLKVWLHRVPPAGAPADDNALLNQADVPARGTLCGDGVLTLEAGWSLRAKASTAAGLTVALSGATST